MGHDAENCPTFPFARVDHPDARLGAAVPHMLGELNVDMGDHRHVFVNGARYYIGSASGEGCNCLINTLDQLLGTGVPSRFVRADLQREFSTSPDRVTEGNYLDLRAHWEAIVRSLSRHSRRLSTPIDPSSLRLVCADLVYLGQGDVVGEEGRLSF